MTPVELCTSPGHTHTHTHTRARAQVLQWVKSDRAVVELQELGVYLGGVSAGGGGGDSERELDHQAASAAQVVSDERVGCKETELITQITR